MWRFALDRADAGVKEQWFSRDLTDHITMPGILQSQGYGDDITADTPFVAALPRDMRWYLLPQYQAYTKPGNVKVRYLSQPVKHYLGVAWYQRDITIPAAWQVGEGQQGIENRIFADRRRPGDHQQQPCSLVK